MDDRDSHALKCYHAAQTPDVALVFSRQPGLYVMLGPCATLVAREVVKTMSVLKNWGTDENPIFAVSVNEAVLKASVSFLVGEAGKSVQIFEKKDEGYTPGEVITSASLMDFEDDNDASTKVSASLRCALLVARDGNDFAVSVAALSTTSRCISFSSFTDSYQLLNLETLLAQCSVREVTLGRGAGVTDEDVGTIQQVCKRSGSSLKIEPLASFSASAAQNILPGLLRGDANLLQLSDFPECLKCVGILVHGLVASRCFQLLYLQPQSLMRLDNASIEGLNIVASNESRSKLPISIFGWLNQCSTAMGSRVLRQWLLQPSTDLGEIKSRLDVLQVLLENPSMRDALLSSLKRLGDIDRVGRKIVRHCASLRELSQLKGFVASLGQVVQVLQLCTTEQRQIIADEYVSPLSDMIELMGNLVTLLDATIETTEDNEFRIRPDFDDDLQSLDVSRAEIRRGIDEEYGLVLKSNKWTDKICKCELHATYGFVLRVSRKDDRAVRESKVLTLLSTSKDGVRFTTSKLNDLSQQYRDYTRTYESRQRSLHQKLLETVATYLPVLDDAKERIARLDVFTAWAGVISKSKLPMSRPSFDDCGLVLEEVWHPLVELRVPNFISNSVKLASPKSTAIITGPNMGGKSTLMRSVGVAVLLAQIGCFVPARSASLSIRDSVMCRIGASDFLAHGMSTFMVEMLETSAIVASATEKSLVIIDELGRGTSTYDGFGLAWAVAEHLSLKKKCWLLFSTHFHEMTDLAAESGAVANLHFAGNTNDGELQFTFQLHEGPCTKSFGIAVADHAKLPKSLIKEALQRAEELEDFAAETVSLTEEQQGRLISFSDAVSKAANDPSALEALRAQIVMDPILKPIFS